MSSHETFLHAIKQLELRHSGRLKETEGQREIIRKVCGYVEGQREKVWVCGYVEGQREKVWVCGYVEGQREIIRNVWMCGYVEGQREIIRKVICHYYVCWAPQNRMMLIFNNVCVRGLPVKIKMHY